MHFPARFLSLTALLASARCETVFTQPGPDPDAGNVDMRLDFSNNPSYKVGDKIDAVWTSNYSRFDLILYEASPIFSPVVLEAGLGRKEYTWEVALDHANGEPGEGYDYVFLFMVSPTTTDGKNDGMEDAAFSSSFNVTAPPKKAKPLSAGAAAGIAVAVTVVGVLAIQMLVFAIWRKHKGLPMLPSWKKNKASVDGDASATEEEKTLEEQNALAKQELIQTPVTPSPGLDESVTTAVQPQHPMVPSQQTTTPQTPVVAELSNDYRVHPAPVYVAPMPSPTPVTPQAGTLKGGELIGD